MYRIITIDGTEIGLTDAIRYIKYSANGTLIEASKTDAIGVAYKGTPYNLARHTEIANAEQVVVCTVNSGEEIAKLIANQDYIAMMSDIELDTEEETTSEVTDDE